MNQRMLLNERLFLTRDVQELHVQETSANAGQLINSNLLLLSQEVCHNINMVEANWSGQRHVIELLTFKTNILVRYTVKYQ